MTTAIGGGFLSYIKDEKTDQIIKEIKEYEEFPLADDVVLNEFRNAVKISIEFMGKHIDKGLEVYQALDINENERYKLPDFAQLMIVRQPQQLIVDNTKKVVNNDIPSPDENTNKEKG
jgi:putative N-acetylmannosamine-6-phosphate epimerase